MVSSLVQTFLVASSSLLVGNACAAHAAVYKQRFAATAIETGGPALMPRQYYEAPSHPLLKRQSGVCQPGSHPCNELGPSGEGFCCPNNQYCMIDVASPSQTAACCRIGATCNNSPQSSSPCSEPASFLCHIRVTATVSNTQQVTSQPACCARSCANVSSYQCPSSLGGGCCANTQQCGVSSRCLETIEPSPSSTSALLTPVPEGCVAGQISCPADLGGGCCDDDSVCTRITGTAHCAVKTDLPDGVEGVSEGLSTGAKAGIGVGVVVAAGLVIGAVTWWCIRRRRGGGGGFGGGASGTSGGRPRVRPGQTIGGTENRLDGGGAEGYSDAGVSRSQRDGGGGGGGPPRLEGLAQEYGGGDPALGPYSDEFRGTGPSPPSAVTSPGLEYGMGGVGAGGAVPVIPNGPQDIALPVEIDSRAMRAEQNQGLWGEQHQEMMEQQQQQQQQHYYGQGHSRGGSASTTTAQGQVQGGEGYFGAVSGNDGSGRPRAATNMSSQGGEDMSDRYELYGSDPGQLSPLSLPYEYPTPPEDYNGHHNQGRR